MKPLERKGHTRLIKILMLIMISMLPHIAMADDDPGPCPDCPIDGGLVLLLIVAVAYGVIKYWGGRRRVNSLPN